MSRRSHEEQASCHRISLQSISKQTLKQNKPGYCEMQLLALLGRVADGCRLRGKTRT